MAPRLRLFILSFIAFFLLGSCDAQSTIKADTLTAQQLKPYGRYLYNQQHNLELISSAVHFGISFTGETCALYVSLADASAHNYLQYELDGVYQKRLRVNGNSKAPIVITTTPGKHTIWIYKATEAHTGAIIIEKIAAEKITPLSVQKLPLIEFIGNSITCGAAADASEVPCGTGAYHDQHNAYMAYGPRVARALKTNFILSSVSGIGIYRTWNMDSPSMPQVYENADFQVGGQQKWDFTTYSPKIVSIALGTNDISKGDRVHPRKPFDTAVYEGNFVKFIQLVKTKYPKAQIALLSSPMVKGESGKMLENCLRSIKAKIDALYPKDKPVATFFFPPMDPRGCSGHPSVEDHAILAEQLNPFFKKLLKD
ncbi:GDSL-type esterase/lipase family protein [Mucilaginibacter sp.]|uniref:SGNH/GDSL hydrolase family protein n=1 Tax=Mucilaginibacter sp. TaxID=1882438 RepID=UPI003267344E